MTIRTAIYLSGNKSKLYPNIAPHLQDGKRKVLADLFGGSGIISLNVVNDNLFEKVIYNDKAEWLYNLNTYLKEYDCLTALEKLHNEYGKSQAEYYRLQNDYNSKPTFAKLFLLMCRGNSNMVRFNSEGKHNMSWGDRNPFFPERILKHQQLIQNVELWNRDFGDAIEDMLESGDLSATTVYVDCPYYSTTAVYNENGGWSQNDNTTLFEYLLELQLYGAKVVMSNVFENRGYVHQELIDWCEQHKDKFDAHHLNISYNNNSSFRKGKGNTDEVLIVSK